MFGRKKYETVKAGETPELVWNLEKKKQKRKIAVVGISRGAGTTFVSVSLAFFLSMSKNDEFEKTHKERNPLDLPVLPASVTLLEMGPLDPGQSGIYCSAALDRRFCGRRFTDFFAQYRSGQALPQTVNLYRGINWAVRKQRGECPYADGLRNFPLEQMPGMYLVADSPPLDTLPQYDLVAAVINPMPSAVYAGAEVYEALRDMEAGGHSVLWILNRDSDAVNHESLKRFLKLKEYLSIPLEPETLFYRAEYEGKLAAEMMEGPAKEALRHLTDRVITMLQDKEKIPRP